MTIPQFCIADFIDATKQGPLALTNVNIDRSQHLAGRSHASATCKRKLTHTFDRPQSEV